MATKFLGIYREIEHSPERESDDHAILYQTGRALEALGVTVELKEPQAVYKAKQDIAKRLPDIAFVMCEQERMLKLLEQWEFKGSVVINSSRAIQNTYRFCMIPALRQAKVPMPKSEFIPTATPDRAAQWVAGGKKIWIKRWDVHNTQKHLDVVAAESLGRVEEVFKDFSARGIQKAVLQEHVPGDLIKFYGVGGNTLDATWFKWFYHKNQDLKRHTFSEAKLQSIVFNAANTLGLEVFGGDAIVNAKGEIFLIDINAWPSFALFRDEASKAIAQYLFSRSRNKVQYSTR